MAKDHNTLMKEFPINDLFIAADLGKIGECVQAIFLHLRRIKLSKYPFERFVRLVEAISSDLSIQMIILRRKVFLLLTFFFF